MKSSRPHELPGQAAVRRGVLRRIVDRFHHRPDLPPPAPVVKVTPMPTGGRGIRRRLLSGGWTDAPAFTWWDVVSRPGPVKYSHETIRMGEYYQQKFPTVTVETAPLPADFTGANRATRRAMGQRRQKVGVA